MITSHTRLLCFSLLALACSSSNGMDAGSNETDSGPNDAGLADAGAHDAGIIDAGEVDAGDLDAGSADSGPAAPALISGACQQNGDCQRSLCDTEAPGGYCTAECQVNDDCPTGSACLQLGNGLTMCAQVCMADSDCRGSYQCAAVWSVCAPVTKGCQKDTDCPTGQTCNTDLGFCTGAAAKQNTVGGACAQPDDCSVGPDPFCIPSTEDFVGGYCSSTCQSNSDCDGDVCVMNLFTAPICFASCTTTADCRPNYNCVTYEGQQFCLNGCKTDYDCLYAEQTCNTQTGLCSNDNADGGVTDGGPTECPGVSLGMDAGSSDGGPDGGTDAGVVDAGVEMYTYDGGYPAPFPTPPQVANAGGTTLSHANFIPIFFSNDDTSDVQQIEAFDNQIGGSSYWMTIGAEYGIGAATCAAPITVDSISTGTIDDSDIGPWLDSEIQAGVLPAPDSSTLYLIHYPTSTTIMLSGSASCTTFGAYHTEYTLTGGKKVPYAVMPRCQPYMGMGTAIQIETGSESHEMFEASTDPFPSTDPAWSQVEKDYGYWTAVLGGSELGDMCAQNPGAFTEFTGLPFMVQRMWSNSAVEEGHDPCIPALPNEVYFNGIPEMNDMITAGGETVVGISVPGCTPRTVDIDLYSDGPISAPWSVQVEDLGSLNSYPNGTLSFSLKPQSGFNGDKLSLTIEPLQANPGNLEGFFVISTSGQQQNFWIGAVGQ